MMKFISAYGTVRTFNADGQRIEDIEDGIEIKAWSQNCGDCTMIVSSDGIECNDRVFMQFDLSQDDIDALIIKLQECKAQKIKWDEKYGNNQ